MSERGRRSAADLAGLVRPYVRDGNGPPPPPWGDHYHHDPFAPRPLADPGWPGWPEGPDQPDPVRPGRDGPLPGPDGRALDDRPLDDRPLDNRVLMDWSVALRRRPWPAAIGAAAGIAIACALIFFLPAMRTGSCAGRSCRAIAAGLPSSRLGVSSASPTRAPAAPAWASARPYTPRPSASEPTGAPSEPTKARPPITKPSSATPGSGTAPLVEVTVSYKAVRFTDGGFEGEFTITNGGTAPIRGWQLTVVLPGDHVLAAWNAGFRATGDTLVLTPHAARVIIEPGASLAEHFIAMGAHTVPRACTFDGAPCI